MAILKKEEYFNKLNERLKGDTSEEGIAFLEDMTDTYNDLENRANGDGEDWEKKYHELDESWKARYKHRFFSGDTGNYTPNGGKEEEPEITAENIMVEDLFEEKER